MAAAHDHDRTPEGAAARPSEAGATGEAAPEPPSTSAPEPPSTPPSTPAPEPQSTSPSEPPSAPPSTSRSTPPSAHPTPPAAPGATGAGRSAGRAARRARSVSVRARVLSTMLAFMAAGLAITGVVTFVAQFRSLEDRVDRELQQELDELRTVAEDTDADGQPVHTDVQSLLLAVTSTAYPSDHESVLALVGEEKFRPQVQDFNLWDPGDEETVEFIRSHHRPGESLLTTTSVGGRELRILISSVQVAGDSREGIFVVASDIGAPRRDLWSSVLVYVAISLVTLLIAGAVGSRVTGRLLRPLGDLRQATEQITVEDLQRRVPVPDARDDVAALAQNFNRMLERIQSGFAEQRRFMSDVGHELRTPLTIVRGTLEMSDPEDSGDVREAHEIALDELDRMGRVVGDLSELAASARPDYVRPRPLDMARFARSALARIERIDERPWVLDAAAEVTADVDEQRLMQAVVQLAANAVRYSEPGSPIGLGVARVIGADGPEIHVHVRDEGIGIAPEDQARIFERFARVDDGRAGGTPGTGLGLPIVQAIAEGHGGTVRVHSQLGAGSQLTLVLPQHATADQTVRPPSDPAAERTS